MDEIRELIQGKLAEITSVDCGVPIPDGMVEDGETYFGYELQEEYIDSDLGKNYTMEINLTGRLVRKENPEENTLQIMDNALSEIKEKLKELNFKYSYNDISFDNSIRKMLVKARVRYNEMNKEFIV